MNRLRGLAATASGEGRDVSASRDDWANMLSRAPLLDAPIEHKTGCVVRRWKDTHPDVKQPSLHDHYVVLHMGGPKRVYRHAEGRSLVNDIDFDAISIVPSGAAYDWRTEGPIDYAHLYIPPDRLARAAETIFDREIGGLRLQEHIGRRDELLAALFQAILRAAEDPQRRGVYLDTLTEAFLGRLLEAHTNLSGQIRPAQYSLAPKRLADVTAYVEAHLAEPISLDDLAAVGRLSRYHFARAFSKAAGATPHAFIMQRRLEAAKRLLREGVVSLAEVAERCGYANASHLSNRFRRAEGCAPSLYRRQH